MKTLDYFKPATILEKIGVTLGIVKPRPVQLEYRSICTPLKGKIPRYNVKTTFYVTYTDGSKQIFEHVIKLPGVTPSMDVQAECTTKDIPRLIISRFNKDFGARVVIAQVTLDQIIRL